MSLNSVARNYIEQYCEYILISDSLKRGREYLLDYKGYIYFVDENWDVWYIGEESEETIKLVEEIFNPHSGQPVRGQQKGIGWKVRNYLIGHFELKKEIPLIPAEMLLKRKEEMIKAFLEKREKYRNL